MRTKKIRKPNERLVRVFAHELMRKTYLIYGTPLTNELNIKWLKTNHSRKKIKKK